MAKKTRTKKPNCKKGFPCGRTCLPKKTRDGKRDTQCKNNVDANGNKIVETYTQYVKRLEGEKDQPEPTKRKKKKSIKDLAEINPKKIKRNDGEGFFTSKYTTKGGNKVEIMAEATEDFGDSEGDSGDSNYGIDFKVNDSFNAETGISRAEKMEIALFLKEEFSRILSKLPEGTVFETDAYDGDGNGKKRKNAYEKMGFGFGEKTFKLYGMGKLENGKLIPINPETYFSEDDTPLTAEIFYELLFLEEFESDQEEN